MKKLISLSLLIAFLFIGNYASSQNKKASPNTTATGKSGNVTISINYSSPSVKGRKVWGDLVPFGKVWRTGADEATIFETDGDLKIEGQKLSKGKYSLFTIPEENSWTIIINKKANQWGAYSYKQEDDVLRVKVKPGKSASFNESLAFAIADGKVFIRWENMEVAFKAQ